MKTIIYLKYIFFSVVCTLKEATLSWHQSCRLAVGLFLGRWLNRRLQIFCCIFWLDPCNRWLDRCRSTEVVEAGYCGSVVLFSSIFDIDDNILFFDSFLSIDLFLFVLAFFTCFARFTEIYFFWLEIRMIFIHLSRSQLVQKY